MPKLKVVEQAVKYSGIFDLKELYNLIIKFFKNKGYDVTKPIQIVNAKEYGKLNGVVPLIFEFKLNDYFKVSIKLTLLFSDVESIKLKNTLSNEEINLNQGKVSVKFEGFIVYDYDKKFSSYGIIGEVFRTLTENFFLKEQVKSAKEILRKHILSAIEMLERYFNLEIVKKKIL